MSSMLAPPRESVTGAAADASAGPARTMVITAALDDLSAPERMEVAKSALEGLSVAARLHVTGDALAVLGSDEAVRAARRGEAELILAQADAATSEHAVDRLGARLDEPARARLGGRLLEGLRHEVREALFTALSIQPADGGAVADGKTGQPDEAATGSGTLAALARAGQVIDGVADETLSGAVDDEELRCSVDRLVVLGRKVDAERLRRLDEITGRGSHGARSTADMVRERYGLTSGAAQREVEIARRLRRLPDTRRKLQEGSLDRSHAEQAGKALADVERAASRGALTKEQARRGAEKVDRLAAGAGPSEDANGLARRLHDANVAGGALDLAERDRRAHAGRRLWMGKSSRPGEEGMTALDGALAPVAAQQLRSVLERLARPTGAADDRTHLQRMADALVHLANGTSPAAGPEHSAASSTNSPTTPPPASGNATPPPARVLLITTSAALNDVPDAEPSWLDGHGPVGSATSKQICCDAEIRLVTLDDAGQPLNVGRRHRQPNDAQRAAVSARDRHCVGCHAPASVSQCHHIRWWGRDQGRTDLDNLCLLCPSCHTNVHHFGWTVERASDGAYVARPPPSRRHDPAGPSR